MYRYVGRECDHGGLFVMEYYSGGRSGASQIQHTGAIKITLLK